MPSPCLSVMIFAKSDGAVRLRAKVRGGSGAVMIVGAVGVEVSRYLARAMTMRTGPPLRQPSR
jgi:hypothetical protein